MSGRDSIKNCEIEVNRAPFERPLDELLICDRFTWLRFSAGASKNGVNEDKILRSRVKYHEKTKESLTVKEEEDAIQESSTEEVDVQEQAGVSEGVREGDTSEQVTTEEITPQEAQELDGGAQIQEVTEEEVAEPGLSPQEIEVQELEDIREEFAEVSEDTQSEGTNLEGNLFLKGAESQLPITERKKRTSLIKRGKSAIRSIRKILPNTKNILNNKHANHKICSNHYQRELFQMPNRQILYQTN